MAGKYTVKQGDYVAKIAKENGFVDYRTIWDHAKNQQLKNKRKNPNVLFPGDELYIPDKGDREESAATDQRHKYKAKVSKNMLRLVLEDLYGNPIANAKCDLQVEGKVIEVVSGADGKIEPGIKPVMLLQFQRERLLSVRIGGETIPRALPCLDLRFAVVVLDVPEMPGAH